MGSRLDSVAALPHEIAQAAIQLGPNIRLARIRRRMSQEELAQACGISRKTVYGLEKGSSGVTIGAVFAVLWKLGLLGTADTLADPENDEHGKILEAARRPKRVRNPVKINNDF